MWVCAVFVGRCVLWLWGCCNCFDEISNSFSPAYHLKAQIFSIFAGGMKRWHNFYLIVCQQLFCCLNCFFLQRCLILFIHLFWHAVLSEQMCSFCFTSPVFVLKKGPQESQEEGSRGSQLQCVLHVWAGPDPGIQRGECCWNHFLFHGFPFGRELPRNIAKGVLICESAHQGSGISALKNKLHNALHKKVSTFFLCLSTCIVHCGSMRTCLFACLLAWQQ